ncbi:MAG: SDR family oxidoreductase [Fischerella sp.]|nr:SDR family oxidoreductase [Fischerella sp.]
MLITYELSIELNYFSKSGRQVRTAHTPDFFVIELKWAGWEEFKVKTLDQKIDRLDVLINNAVVYPDEGVNILAISRELLDSTINTNAPMPLVQFG